MRLYFYVVAALISTLTFQSCHVEKVSSLNDGSTDFVWSEEVLNDSLVIQRYLFGNYYKKVKKSAALYDKVNEECTYYYRNGNVMSYKLYNEGALRYYRNYDTKGVAKSYNGSGVLYEDSLVYDTIFTNVQYKRDMMFVNPPNAEVTVMIGDFIEDEENRDLKKYPLYFYPIIDSKASYQVNYKKEGIRKVVVYWAIEDLKSKDMQKGRIIHQYTVMSSTQK
ncbi:hypothetical protein SAMN06265379_101963 [Saccharicrinis carchari]|uniref:Lipoprotein n=1 Tax=Saccharicrinis carchari TaxID=1168039 RepID=A0A521BIX9_SACCC|nr:hypothetical protein [Saccharicrinis carchari]SMO46841.1 hypothetical protein SAMN06265379_101963 [Saccharicrinis carchari]